MECGASQHCPCRHSHTTVPAGTNANTCTKQPPNTPNNASAVGSMLLFSTSSSMTNPQRVNGYAQVYTQVSFKQSLGIWCLSESPGRREPMPLGEVHHNHACSRLRVWRTSRSRRGASQLQILPPASLELSIPLDSCLTRGWGGGLLCIASQHHRHTCPCTKAKHQPASWNMRTAQACRPCTDKMSKQSSRQHAYPAGVPRQPLPQRLAFSSQHAHAYAQGRGASDCMRTAQAQLLPVQSPKAVQLSGCLQRWACTSTCLAQWRFSACTHRTGHIITPPLV